MQDKKVISKGSTIRITADFSVEFFHTIYFNHIISLTSTHPLSFSPPHPPNFVFSLTLSLLSPCLSTKKNKTKNWKLNSDKNFKKRKERQATTTKNTKSLNNTTQKVHKTTLCSFCVGQIVPGLDPSLGCGCYT